MLDRAETQRRERIVVEEYEGILPHCEAFYIHSIHYSANRSIAAFVRYRDAVKNGSSRGLIVASIHESLAHAAALSHFFWPIKKTLVAQTRANKLRDAFALNDESPLKNRQLRNGLEHFDERLDDYLIEHATGNFSPAATIGSHEEADDPEAKIFKLVDIDAHVFVLLGEKYVFSAIIEEVDRVLDRADEMAKSDRLAPQEANKA